jgi:serine protease AprX
VAALAALGLAITTSVTPDAESAEAAPLPTVTGEAEITLSMSVEPGQPVPLALIRKKAAKQYDDKGALGQGIDVALIDSGVTQVAGLDQPGKVIYGPDLSNEGGIPNLANLDTFGHGTHLAGIIAGDDGDQVLGIAPESRLVSLKVAGATGETHIAQVIAAIDWVVEHKNDNGMNIRVLNLSLGTGGIPTTSGDPFSAAVERAWNAGIVVVAAAGNRGNMVGGIDSPALSPYVMAVGATESYNSWGRGDKVPSWTSGGNTYRTPDVLAPGRSIMSFRVPGSFLDQLHPQAVVDDKYFVGSGSSQSAAVQTGYVAGLLSKNPSLTPDQVKYLFTRYAKDTIPGDLIDGKGKINPKASARRNHKAWKAPVQNHPLAITPGQGSPNGATWSGGGWNGASWSGGTWSGASWSGASWSGASWSGASWSGASWSGASWSSAAWESVSATDAPLETAEDLAVDAVLEQEDAIYEELVQQDDTLVDDLLENEDVLYESLLEENDAIVDTLLEETSPAVDPTIEEDVALVEDIIEEVTSEVTS